MRVAVHKFTSCDGCQLSFLNLGEDLLTLTELVEIVHFAEAGPVDPDAPVDIAFIEGSISTPDEQLRIERIRNNSKFLVTIGACATAGGLQALRNFQDSGDWLPAIYAEPQHIQTLELVTPIRDHVKVDLELWGCPVDSRQVVAAIRSLLFGVLPTKETDKVCMECKRQQTVCVLVTDKIPCMGAVTLSGCGALCPRFGRDCYGCYGPSEHPNTESLGQRFTGLGLLSYQISRRFLSFNNHSPAFHAAGLHYRSHE